MPKAKKKKPDRWKVNFIFSTLVKKGLNKFVKKVNIPIKKRVDKIHPGLVLEALAANLLKQVKEKPIYVAIFRRKAEHYRKEYKRVRGNKGNSKEE